MAARAVAAAVEGRLLDLTAPVPETDRLEVLTFEDEAGREVLRHTASHVMAQAVQELFPAPHLAIGPAIEDGFYYDFDLQQAFEPEDLAKIEAKMAEIVGAGSARCGARSSRGPRRTRSSPRKGEKYKVELIEDIADDTVSLYSQDDFVDLCRGPHLPSTGAAEGLQAAGGGRGLLAGRREEPDAPAHLRHRLPDPGASSTSTWSGWRRRSGATTGGWGGSSTCSASPRRSAAGWCSGTRRARWSAT